MSSEKLFSGYSGRIILSFWKRKKRVWELSKLSEFILIQVVFRFAGPISSCSFASGVISHSGGGHHVVTGGGGGEH